MSRNNKEHSRADDDAVARYILERTSDFNLKVAKMAKYWTKDGAQKVYTYLNSREFKDRCDLEGMLGRIASESSKLGGSIDPEVKKQFVDVFFSEELTKIEDMALADVGTRADRAEELTCPKCGSSDVAEHKDYVNRFTNERIRYCYCNECENHFNVKDSGME